MWNRLQKLYNFVSSLCALKCSFIRWKCKLQVEPTSKSLRRKKRNWLAILQHVRYHCTGTLTAIFILQGIDTKHFDLTSLPLALLPLASLPFGSKLGLNKFEIHFIPWPREILSKQYNYLKQIQSIISNKSINSLNSTNLIFFVLVRFDQCDQCDRSHCFDQSNKSDQPKS